MSSSGSHANSDLPAVDERLVAPESGYEIDDGKLVYVPPSDEPHGVGQIGLGALLLAHRSPDRNVAADMLTRTAVDSDFAPDASVYPSERNPRTGGRQLEELAFEVLATERLGHAGDKAAKLIHRGVRRVFAIDVARLRAFEWSPELGTWGMLAPDSRIEDPALAVPLPVAALVDAAKVEDASVQAYRTKRHPEFLAERAEGRTEGRAEGRTEGRAEGRIEGWIDAITVVLAIRGLPISTAERQRIAAERDPLRIQRWVSRAATCVSVAALIDD